MNQKNNTENSKSKSDEMDKQTKQVKDSFPSFRSIAKLYLYNFLFFLIMGIVLFFLNMCANMCANGFAGKHSSHNLTSVIGPYALIMFLVAAGGALLITAFYSVVLLIGRLRFKLSFHSDREYETYTRDLNEGQRFGSDIILGNTYLILFNTHIHIDDIISVERKTDIIGTRFEYMLCVQHYCGGMTKSQKFCFSEEDYSYYLPLLFEELKKLDNGIIIKD